METNKTTAENNLRKYTVDEALNELQKKEEEYAKKYINKELTDQPQAYEFLDKAAFREQTFKRPNGEEKVIGVWHFYTVDNREFTTSNIQLAKEMLQAIKDGKRKISLAHKSVKGRDNQYHDTIALINAE